ncbi:hypothetical protein [Kordiimonas gwangyangensis]|jgi:hypothetical protein|uniref:hypothetical protein n=1 Tax=Kordiimonas gwangyangensis TaxID=288022 RepID=UPI000374CA5B|nr:hypothetical protein [Kordiimonas gwangyangensis]
MRAKDALILSILGLGLGACSISVEGEGNGYGPRHHNWDGGRATVKLPDGDKVTFGCPEGTTLFVRDRTDKGGDLVYGCRTGGSDVTIDVD